MPWRPPRTGVVAMSLLRMLVVSHYEQNPMMRTRNCGQSSQSTYSNLPREIQGGSWSQRLCLALGCGKASATKWDSRGLLPALKTDR
mmetsp:Transcript_72044/g.206795  ORF Transcript_72044/g.206795 Transcript_72044/m.206795 type:complete len:87 (+) Transcript_72044:773-1033(+)